MLSQHLDVPPSTSNKMADSATAKATFELSNNIQTVPSVDAVFKYDRAKQQELLSAKPWEKELSSLSISLSFHLLFNFICLAITTSRR